MSSTSQSRVNAFENHDPRPDSCEVFRVVSGPWRENCYIAVSRGGRCGVIIDPGSAVDEIWQTVCSQQIETQAILLTHAHYDHVEGVAALCKRTHARVYLHQEDLTVLRNANTCAFAWKLPPLRVFVPDVLLTTDETLNFADLSVATIHLPGHSPGSVVYSIGQMLFVGDTILPHSVGRVDLPGGDAAALARSLRKIAPWLGTGTTLFPGHGEPLGLPALLSGNKRVRTALLEANLIEQMATADSPRSS